MAGRRKNGQEFQGGEVVDRTRTRGKTTTGRGVMGNGRYIDQPGERPMATTRNPEKKQGRYVNQAGERPVATRRYGEVGGTLNQRQISSLNKASKNDNKMTVRDSNGNQTTRKIIGNAFDRAAEATERKAKEKKPSWYSGGSKVKSTSVKKSGSK